MSRLVCVMAAIGMLTIVGGTAFAGSLSLNYYDDGYGTFTGSFDADDGELGGIIYTTDYNPVYIYWHVRANDGYPYATYKGPGDYLYYFGFDEGCRFDCNSSRHLTSVSWRHYIYQFWGSNPAPNPRADITLIVSPAPITTHRITGTTECIDTTTLYIKNSTGLYAEDAYTTDAGYSFLIFNGSEYRIVFDGAYYDFVCDGSDVVFDYDACIWVYGYTCGVDNIKLYNDTSGWVLDDSVGQSTGYDMYEMQIEAGEDYKISFIDSTIDGDFVVHNQTFSCSGDHVIIDFDRCEWIYPISPPAQPYIIYLWAGYDYNIVVFKDEHGNFIENSQIAIYDKTDNKYIQRWTDASDGYALLGAKFATDHDVRLSIRTFDGIFTLDTTYPANGSAAVGEEDITTTNWTIPIKYNLNVLPVDQYGVSLFDVFCGLSEYTPLNPGAFWGMDLSDQGYVAVTNCSGFAMCDIIAEKPGYADYKVEALNWTSKSALAKDYRHNIVMEEE